MSPSQVPVTTLSIGDQEVTTSANSTNAFSEIIDIQVPQGFKYEFPSDRGLSMYVLLHESITGAGTGTNTQTLGNDLVNSPTVADVPTGNDDSTEVSGRHDLVIWDDGRDYQTSVDTVDYDANSFDYNNQSGDPSDLEVYYLWGDPSQLEFRTYGGTENESGFEKKAITTMREFHMANVYSKDERVTFSDSFVLRQDEHLKVEVKTAVDLANWDAQVGDGSSSTPGDIETYSYSNFQIPVRRIPL